MNASFGPCTVTLYESVYPDGEVIERVKITTLGESPNLTAKLYVWEPGAFGVHRFVEIDRMTGCTVTNTTDGFVIAGISDQLRFEVGVNDNDTLTRWDVSVKGCPTC